MGILGKEKNVSLFCNGKMRCPSFGFNCGRSPRKSKPIATIYNLLSIIFKLKKLQVLNTRKKMKNPNLGGQLWKPKNEAKPSS